MIVPERNWGLTVAPLYLSFIENEKASKDKHTNFIRAILLSNWQLATGENQGSETYKKNKQIRTWKYRQH